MGYPSSTVVTGPLSVSNIIDTYPTHWDILGYGGLMSVAALTDRNAIPLARRKFGMFVTVYADPTPANNKTYRLANVDLGGADGVLTNNSNWIIFTSGGSLADGDKGDITVSSSGTVWTIDNTAVSYAKIQNVTQARILGRYTASTGVTQEISIGSGLALNSGTGVLSATAQTATIFKEQTFIASGSTAIFTVSNGTIDQIESVYVNGYEQTITTQFTVTGQIIDFGTNPPAGAEITIKYFEGLVIANMSFLDLNDTPNSYSSQALKLVRVNAGATGLEFSNGDFWSLSGGGVITATNTLSGTKGVNFTNYETGVGSIILAPTYTANTFGTLIIAPTITGASQASLGTAGSAVLYGNGVTASANNAFHKHVNYAHTYNNGGFNGVTFIGNYYNPVLTGVGTGTKHYAAIYESGSIGIGVNAPTATLHLKAGTSTTPSLKVNKGTLVTTIAGSVNDGAMEYDTATNHLYFTIGSTRFQLDQQSGGSGITSLNGLTPTSQTFANDTNVTIASAGSTHTITWAGTLADGRISSAATWHAKIGGSGSIDQVAFFTSTNVIAGDTNITYNPTTNKLSVDNILLSTISNNDALNEVIVRDSGTGDLKYRAASTLITTGSNGLTFASGNIKLGGTLSNTTLIDGNFQVLLGSVTPINNFLVTSTGAIILGATSAMSLSSSAGLSIGSVSGTTINVGSLITNIGGDVGGTGDVLKSNGSGGVLWDLPFTLTNIGTSGAASYTSGVLNIPNYTSTPTTPAGSNTQIQFNNAGAFGAVSTLFWDTFQIVVGSYAGTYAAYGPGGINFSGAIGNNIIAYGGASLDILTSGGNGTITIGASGSGDTKIVTNGASGNYLLLVGLPTSSAGLPSGAIWRNGNVLTIVP